MHNFLISFTQFIVIRNEGEVSKEMQTLSVYSNYSKVYKYLSLTRENKIYFLNIITNNKESYTFFKRIKNLKDIYFRLEFSNLIPNLLKYVKKEHLGLLTEFIPTLNNFNNPLTGNLILNIEFNENSNVFLNRTA